MTGRVVEKLCAKKFALIFWTLDQGGNPGLPEPSSQERTVEPEPSGTESETGTMPFCYDWTKTQRKPTSTSEMRGSAGEGAAPRSFPTFQETHPSQHPRQHSCQHPELSQHSSQHPPQPFSGFPRSCAQEAAQCPPKGCSRKVPPSSSSS